MNILAKSLFGILASSATSERVFSSSGRILEKRRQIIDGSNEQSSEDIQQLNLSEKGIPNFWQIVLKNLDSYDYPMQSLDELCLKYLIDIRCKLHPRNSNSTSFTLEFHFLPTNPFFIETILTKHYFIRLEIDDSNQYRKYDGHEVDRCYGCTITWKPNHNLTIRKRNKRLRNKLTGQMRLIEVEEPIKSFFNFFSLK